MGKQVTQYCLRHEKFQFFVGVPLRQMLLLPELNFLNTVLQYTIVCA